MYITFITRRIPNRKTGKAKEWIVDAYQDGEKFPDWFRAKTLKACRERMYNRDELNIFIPQ